MKIDTDFHIGHGIAFIFSIGLVNDASTMDRDGGNWEFWFVAEFINVRLGINMNW
jgi:hypothetical protein